MLIELLKSISRRMYSYMKEFLISPFIKQVAKSILDLSDSGIQVFIATHSLFLLRELEILLSDPIRKKVKVKFFGLHQTDDGVRIDQGSTIDDIGDIAALDEELAQSDRFLAVD